MIAAFDLSMRSIGIILLSEKGDLVDYVVVSNKTITDEDLMEYNIHSVLNFLEPYREKIKHIVIEGLSYMGVCRRKDLLYGNYWGIRYFLKQKFKEKVDYTIYSVAQWRKSVISKERAKEIKITGGQKKGWQKVECVDRLPKKIRSTFEEYIKINKFKKDAIFDLCDAYYLGKFKLIDDKNHN